MILVALLACRDTLVAHPVSARDPLKRWDAALNAVVTEDGLVDYDALEARRDDLDAFVAFLGRPHALGGPKKMDRHALWLNAYNALVMFQVLERGRPESVLDVPGVVPIPGSGFFLETDFRVGGERLSLSEIEHERVRMLELDLRDHAALNCASRSCPPLRASLYVQQGLPGQLDAQMRRWVNDPERGVRVDGEVAHFSAIFDWYARDFEFMSAGRDPCAIAATYADPPLSDRLLTLSERGCPRAFLPYDWSLNDASPGTPRGG